MEFLLYIIDGQRIDLNYERSEVKKNYILPIVALIFSRSSKPDLDTKAVDMIIKNPIIRLSIVRDSYSYLNIGSSPATKLLYTWDKSGKSELVFDFSLDNYLLSEIENIRSGGDLNLSADISLLAKTHDQSYIIEEHECPFSIKFTIAKSEWNDKILPQLISKKVTLITIPIIDLPEIPLTYDLIKYLNEAHKALNDGRYGDVFGECRQAVNALYNGIERWGKSQLTDDDKKKFKILLKGQIL